MKNLFLLLVIFCAIRFEVHSQTFALTGELINSRYEHQSQLLSNGKVLAFGGLYSDGINNLFFNESELYNPGTGTWSASGDMQVPRAYFASVILDNGKVLAIGGANGQDYDGMRSCELYDPASGQWTYTDSTITQRSFHDAVKLNDGRVLIAGGAYADEEAEIYDPASSTWSATGNLNNVYGTYLSLVLLSNGNVLATGGSEAEIYDPPTGQWTAVPGGTVHPESNHSSVLLNNGNVLLVSEYCEIYDAGTNSFSTTDAPEISRQYNPAIKLDNGNVLVFGWGEFFSFTDTKAIEVYNVSTGQWFVPQAYDEYAVNRYTIHKLQNGKILAVAGVNPAIACDSSYLITESGGSAIESIKFAIEVSVYPNPASEQVIIESLSENISSIIIHDLLGKEILRMEEMNDQKISVSLDGISSGVYLVKIVTDEGEVVKKIVVE